MDSLDRTHAGSSATPHAADDPHSEPQLSLSAMRQQLATLRREARLHEREALAECLTLAISLSSPRRNA